MNEFDEKLALGESINIDEWLVSKIKWPQYDIEFQPEWAKQKLRDDEAKMFANPKPLRYVNETFLQFVRDQPCCACGQHGVDAHHTKTRGSGGSDLTAIPLCRGHHSLMHQIGFKKFEQVHSIDLYEVRVILLEKFIMDQE